MPESNTLLTVFICG